MTTTNHKHDRINEALALLSEEAKEKKEDLYESIGDKYSDIKDFLAEQAQNGKDVLYRSKEQLVKTYHEEEEKLRKKAMEIDKKVHSNPWPFLGVAALGALIAGIVIGKKK